MNLEERAKEIKELYYDFLNDDNDNRKLEDWICPYIEKQIADAVKQARIELLKEIQIKIRIENNYDFLDELEKE